MEKKGTDVPSPGTGGEVKDRDPLARGTEEGLETTPSKCTLSRDTEEGETSRTGMDRSSRHSGLLSRKGNRYFSLRTHLVRWVGRQRDDIL